jgi:CheY-like chemotaxis protein
VPEFLIGDPLRLKQVLINLCNNSIKFTAEGFVRIRVSAINRNENSMRLHFEVQDSGIGISPENQLKLFKSFAQADVSTTRKYGGTGLGLAISKSLVQLMKGEIGVISEEGKGAIFHFDAEFGVDQSNIALEESNDLENILILDKKFKILLAEDNVINQKIAILNLEKLGHTVLVVSDGIQAVETFIQELPDIIFMDIQMPKMDGVEATLKIREWEFEHKENNHVIIVAMTGNILASDQKLYTEAGINDFLEKPFNLNDVVRLLSRIEKKVNYNTNNQ